MIALEMIQDKLGGAEPLVESRGTYWFKPGSAGVRDVALIMKEAGARFVTITAYELPAGAGFRLEYHWDLGGRLLGVPFEIAGNSIDSIYDLCPAADWIEREVYEGFAITFAGRDYEPLLLKPGDKPGVNLRDPGGAGKTPPGVPVQKEVAP
jgi:NADH:ubiquinone oxidoreductase subunit C